MSVVAQQWISVDGYASGPGGEGDIFAAVPAAADAASQRWNAALLEKVDAVLLGRRSYEMFARFWPGSDEPVAAAVNRIGKVVFSRTLDAAPWGGFAPAAVERDAVGYVRERRGEKLLVWGSLDLMHGLMTAGELDELDLFVAPVALGSGTPLVPAGLSLRLTQLGGELWDGAAHVRYAVGR